MKKLFITSTILLVVVLVFLGVYNFAFKKNQSVAQPLNVKVEPAPVKEPLVIKNEKITVVGSGSIMGASVNKVTEEIVYYDAITGFAWKMDLLGQKKQQITDVKISGLKNISLSPDQSKALTVTQKDNQSIFVMSDLQSKQNVTLKNGLDTAVWDNIGTKIFYKYFDATSKKRTLNIANPDGSAWQKIADIDMRNVAIAPIPLTSLVSFWNVPNASEETQLNVVGSTGGEIKTLIRGKYGADYLWAPDGSKAVFSSLSDKKIPVLGIIYANGVYQDLAIPTLASKCVWAQNNKTIYYALPGGIPNGSVMPNDYQENKFNTEDTFWKIDLNTGEKERIVEAIEVKTKLDSTNMFLSPTEDSLYFINKIDKKLYRIQL